MDPSPGRRRGPDEPEPARPSTRLATQRSPRLPVMPCRAAPRTADRKPAAGDGSGWRWIPRCAVLPCSARRLSTAGAHKLWCSVHIGHAGRATHRPAIEPRRMRAPSCTVECRRSNAPFRSRSSMNCRRRHHVSCSLRKSLSARASTTHRSIHWCWPYPFREREHFNSRPAAFTVNMPPSPMCVSSTSWTRRHPTLLRMWGKRQRGCLAMGYRLGEFVQDHAFTVMAV
jgi:hypothetical protein